MDPLHDKVLFHPRVAEAAIYLAEVMASADSSIGGALIVVAGRLAWRLYRTLARCSYCVE